MEATRSAADGQVPADGGAPPEPVRGEVLPLNGAELDRNIDYAWRCHTAQESWTAKADVKASIFFSVNIAAIIAIVTVREVTDSVLGGLHGWQATTANAGLVLCAIGVLIASAAIFPQLGRPQRHSPSQDMIYFGHLRHYAPERLAAELGQLSPQDQLGQLSRQLVTMARTNWIKHRILQVALLVELVAYGAILVAIAT